MRIALGVSYDGAAYRGWQCQKGLPTIQATLEDALAQIANEPISVVTAGRTDRGVHALGQVVHFDTTADRSTYAWIAGTNGCLPSDVRLVWAKVVEEDFHARFSATSRFYRYLILNSPVRSPHLRNHVSWYPKHLDEQRMQEAAKYLVGEHDFTSFRAAGCQAKSAVRTVYKLDVYRKEEIIFIDIVANAFLQHMVRNIVGVLLLIGRNKKDTAWSQEVLMARDRRQADMTASASGLWLMSINYPLDFNLIQHQSNCCPTINSFLEK